MAWVRRHRRRKLDGGVTDVQAHQRRTGPSADPAASVDPALTAHTADGYDAEPDAAIVGATAEELVGDAVRRSGDLDGVELAAEAGIPLDEIATAVAQGHDLAAYIDERRHRSASSMLGATFEAHARLVDADTVTLLDRIAQGDLPRAAAITATGDATIARTAASTFTVIDHHDRPLPESIVAFIAEVHFDSRPPATGYRLHPDALRLTSLANH